MTGARFPSQPGASYPVPRRLERFDDQLGITWRVINMIRRTSLRRGLWLLAGYARGSACERPVFILGAPRSGTSTLFSLLAESSSLAAPEGHDIWRLLHHPRYSGWRSDRVEASDVRRGERRFVASRFYSHVGTRRLVEKTPENSFRLPYLVELFPDAVFVIQKRDPCDVINSMINGWRNPQGRFRSYYVPQDLRIPGYPQRRRWCFPLIEGWREYTSSTISEIAFAQWDQVTKAIEEGRRLVPPSRWLDVYLEELVERPRETMAHICQWVGISFEPVLERKLEEVLARPVKATSPPRRSKWRTENADEIRSMLPEIAAAASTRGYAVDPLTGDVEPKRPTERSPRVALI